jgi:hypothetical protein
MPTTRPHPGWKRVDAQLVEIAKAGVPFSDVWRFDGDENRLAGLEHLFSKTGVKPPSQAIDEKIERGRCRLMVLGAGEGHDILWLYDRLRQKHGQETLGNTLTIETFNLKRIEDERVRRLVVDHSQPSGFTTPFEVWSAPGLEGKFDVVLSQRGVAWHTESPAAAVVKASTLLSPQGVMYLEVKTPELVREVAETANRFWSLKGKNFGFIDTAGSQANNWLIAERRG